MEAGVILLILAGVGFFIYKRKKDKEEPQPQPTPPKPRKVLFVGAHPDDEIHASIYLKQLPSNVEKGIFCCTNGANNVRRAELKKAAEYLGATLVMEYWPDNHTDHWTQVRKRWQQFLLGENPSEFLAEFIEDHEYTEVVIMDPTHGNFGCHPAHQAISDVAIEAANKAGISRDNIKICTQITVVPESEFGKAFSNSIKMPEPMIYNREGQGETLFASKELWEDTVVKLMQIHKSQFNNRQITLIKKAPQNGRLMTLQPLSKYKYPDIPFCGNYT